MLSEYRYSFRINNTTMRYHFCPAMPWQGWYTIAHTITNLNKLICNCLAAFCWRKISHISSYHRIRKTQKACTLSVMFLFYFFSLIVLLLIDDSMLGAGLQLRQGFDQWMPLFIAPANICVLINFQCVPGAVTKCLNMNRDPVIKKCHTLGMVNSYIKYQQLPINIEDVKDKWGWAPNTNQSVH